MTNTEQIVECIRKYEVRVVTNNADIFILAQNFFPGVLWTVIFHCFSKDSCFLPPYQHLKCRTTQRSETSSHNIYFSCFKVVARHIRIIFVNVDNRVLPQEF